MRFIGVTVLLLLCGLYSFSESAMAATQGVQTSSEGAVAVTVGKDSPSAGKDAFVTLSLSVVEAVKVGKIASEVSYPNDGKIEFDRAELTPDMKSSGARLDVEKGEATGGAAKLKVTITAGKGPILDGIVANLVFKVVNRPKGNNPNELKVALGNKSAVWTVDNREIAIVSSEPGEVDFEYAPVVFACFFYMH